MQFAFHEVGTAGAGRAWVGVKVVGHGGIWVWLAARIMQV
jgi:hypothetical protein